MATFREIKTSKGERRWEAGVRRKGLPPRYARFTTRRDAERWALGLEAKVAENRHLPMMEAERHTLGELLDRHEAELSPKRKKAVAAHLVWWRNALGSTRLSELTTKVIREARDVLIAEPYTRTKERKAITLTKRRKVKNPRPHTRGPATVNRYMETLAKALNVAAKERQWIPKNPCADIADLREPDGRVRFLSDEERAALLKATAELSADLHALVVVALCTGARAGELTGLRWPVVDFGRKRALLATSKNRSRVRRLDTDLLFPGSAPSEPGEPVKPYDYDKDFKAACKAAALANFRFHDLRHTCASDLAMNGATLGEIAEVLGHKTLAMVKRYAHLTQTHVSGVVERMTAKVYPTG